MTADNWARGSVKWEGYGSRTCWGPDYCRLEMFAVHSWLLSWRNFRSRVEPGTMLLASFCTVLCIRVMFYFNCVSWHWRLTDWEIRKFTNVVFIWNSGRAGSKTCLSSHFNTDVTWLFLKCRSNYLWGDAINSSCFLLVWLQCTNVPNMEPQNTEKVSKWIKVQLFCNPNFQHLSLLCVSWYAVLLFYLSY